MTIFVISKEHITIFWKQYAKSNSTLSNFININVTTFVISKEHIIHFLNNMFYLNLFEWSLCFQKILLIKILIQFSSGHSENEGWQIFQLVMLSFTSFKKTLPEAQRTQKLTPWLGLNLATTWHLLHLLQICPPYGATCNS